MDYRYVILGLNVAYYRKLRLLTQEKLAEMLYVTRNCISRIESSDGRPVASMDMIFRIADALDVPVQDLYDFRVLKYLKGKKRGEQMNLNILRTKRLDEVIAMMDITDMKVASDISGRITRIDLELTPQEEDKAGGNKNDQKITG